MYEYMARGALQSLSLPCTTRDAPSEFRMLLHEVMILSTNHLHGYGHPCNNDIFSGCAYLCTRFIQGGIL